MVGARHAHVYVSDAASADAVETALAEPDTETLDGLTVSVRTVEPGYVAGEETAAVRAINGGPAKPTDKPPRPFEQGVGGLPTLISNVETLANLPYIHRHGAQTLPRSGHGDFGGNLPGHRSPAVARTAGPLRAPARRRRSPNCLRCTGFRRRRCAAC